MFDDHRRDVEVVVRNVQGYRLRRGDWGAGEHFEGAVVARNTVRSVRFPANDERSPGPILKLEAGCVDLRGKAAAQPLGRHQACPGKAICQQAGEGFVERCHRCVRTPGWRLRGDGSKPEGIGGQRYPSRKFGRVSF